MLSNFKNDDFFEKKYSFPNFLEKFTNFSKKKEKNYKKEIKNSIKNYLQILLNCNDLIDKKYKKYKSVCKSILNFGIPDVTGRVVSEKKIKKIGILIRDSILNFETRISKKTLQVKYFFSDSFDPYLLYFLIIGDFVFFQESIHFSYKSRIDIETGYIKFIE